MPVKTPRAIVERFRDATLKVAATSAMQQKLAELAVDPMPINPADFDRMVADEIAANQKLIKVSGIK